MRLEWGLSFRSWDDKSKLGILGDWGYREGIREGWFGGLGCKERKS